MKRKLKAVLILAFMVASVIMLSGCVEEEAPVSTPSPTLDEIIEANSIIQDNLNHIENEVFLNNISNFPQSVRLTDANELLENIQEKEKLPIMTDSTGVSPHTPIPFESYYHW